MDCILCNKQYVGREETVFNLRLNNHRPDAKYPNAVLACRHFQQHSYDFNHVKFIVIEKLESSSSPKNILPEPSI